MKLNNKGFTLIELLAVIVVLAIIALIGYSAVGDVISGSQEKADKVSIGEFAKSLSNAVLMEMVESGKGLTVSEITTAIATNKTSDAINTKANSEIGRAIYTGGENITCSSITVDASGTAALTGCYVGTRNTTTYSYADGKVTKD